MKTLMRDAKIGQKIRFFLPMGQQRAYVGTIDGFREDGTPRVAYESGPKIWSTMKKGDLFHPYIPSGETVEVLG